MTTKETLNAYPLGIWVSVLANAVAVCGGSLFLLAPGSRFRGMEPIAQSFVVLTLLATGLGLFAISLAVIDCFRPRYRTWGICGFVHGLTPFLIASLLSHFIAVLLDVNFD